MLGSVSPDGVVVGSLQANLADMRRVRMEVADEGEETGREVLVEEQLHAGGTETNLRSRSAAKARQARMSSRIKSGKSRRISSSLIPDARYSKTSVTVIRRPRMQGLPPCLPGSNVIRERQSTYRHGEGLQLAAGVLHHLLGCIDSLAGVLHVANALLGPVCEADVGRH